MVRVKAEVDVGVRLDARARPQGHVLLLDTVQSLVTGPCRDHPEHVLCLAPLSFHLHSSGDITDDDDENGDDDDDHDDDGDDDDSAVLGHRYLPG